MADGDLIGRRAAFGHVAHGDANATVVVSLPLTPTDDGYWHILARSWGGKSSGANMKSWLIIGLARMDGGAVTVNELTTLGSTGTATLTASGSSVKVSVTSESGQNSGALIEAYGFKLDINLA